MRSSWKIGGLAAVCALLLAVPASAQFVWIGGGPTFPMSNYGDYAKTGFLVNAGVGMPVGEQGLQFGVEGFFGQNNHSDITGDKTNPVGVMADLEFDFAGKGATRSVYLLGGVGLLMHRYSSDTYGSDSSTGLGVMGALGYFFPLGGITGWFEGRIMEARIESENTMFSGIMAGISIPVGSKSGN
jgi:hypothetical protein